MLNKLKQAKAAEIALLAALAEKGELKQQVNLERADFKKALDNPGRISVIAEYKRASPSRGRICSSLDVEDVASQYKNSGASALSILTEETFFDGRLEFIDRACSAVSGEIPILRKDFILDPLQIIASSSTQASAVLLIVRFLSSALEIRKMRELAESYGLDAVIEVFDAQDLTKARDAGATLIQVNARDLQTLKVNRNLCQNLICQYPPEKGEIWIAASGMDSPAHLGAARDMGYNAALIGTALMERGEPGVALSSLIRGLNNAD